ncbi:hypothetical protein AVEN_191698-1 [Araneus ventricosus]|uniref:Secreted protein n=1 Tax=Araneus ventricosus TaxID=182803 RepID=A0A4Y2QD18_ARAVE|nr:hypothetical protein AVEN_191698-1 [Araneus ventricosus]
MWLLLFLIPLVQVLSYTKSKSPLAHRKSRTSAGLSKRFLFSSSIHEISKTIGERFMVKEESAASVGTRPWTPEGRSLTLSIAFML